MPGVGENFNFYYKISYPPMILRCMGPTFLRDYYVGESSSEKCKCLQ